MKGSERVAVLLDILGRLNRLVLPSETIERSKQNFSATCWSDNLDIHHNLTNPLCALSSPIIRFADLSFSGVNSAILRVLTWLAPP